MDRLPGKVARNADRSLRSKWDLPIVANTCIEHSKRTKCDATGGDYETSPQTISASGRGRGRAASFVAICAGASLSIAASAHHRRIWCWRHARHQRAPDSSMAVGAVRPAIYYREPTWRWREYRGRGGDARAGRWAYTALGQFSEC